MLRGAAMYSPASYLGCIWSFGFQANCHLRVNLELRFLHVQPVQVDEPMNTEKPMRIKRPMKIEEREQAAENSANSDLPNFHKTSIEVALAPVG